MPPPPPPPSPSVFDPAPYGGRAADPLSPGEGHQYGAPAPRDTATQTAFPPPPPLADPPFSPQPTGPQQYNPQSTGPQYTSQPTGPQQYTPQPGAPQQYTSQPTGPQYTPQPTGPQYTPQPTGPQYTPQPTGPQYTPQPTGPLPHGPSTGPQQPHTPHPGSASGPQRQAAAGPQAYAPAGDQRYTPSPTGPQGYAPSPSGPQQAPGRQAPPVTGPLQAPTGAYVPAGTETTMRVPGPAAPEAPPGRRHAAPDDPADPYKPFVTAGQISGPKTPPPERQQELWNTVFGENYDAMGEEGDDEAGNGRRVWLPALVASVLVALVAALLWAFLVGPLSGSGGNGSTASGDPSPKSTAKASTSGKGGTGTTKPQSIGRLPRYRGQASPRAGILTDKAAGLSVVRLGGPWRLDLRSQHVQETYGYTTRQYVAAGTDPAGKPQFAHVMTGRLPAALASKYDAAKPDDLAPVISSVAFAARNKFFPAGNKIVKTAEQKVAAGGHPARLAAYQVMAGDAKTTLVVAAVSTGTDLPVIVYMAVPDGKKALLPDVNTVFSSIRPAS
ncbi:hypothetical protein ABZU32_05475 [Sphaerisporangium sp. NPDC005288]|uniref:hypothetical protein n=1 Tax=Sphaerisporangium sp. NPDC005288 TaxID=3155114 RepID=UPI0033B6F0D0